MLRYALLVLAWIFLLVINVLLWINQGSPNVVALGIFAALSLVPIIDWMKIGNWVEFGKKGSRVKDGVTEKQESIVSIGSLNVELANEEAVRSFFAELLNRKYAKELPSFNKLAQEKRDSKELSSLQEVQGEIEVYSKSSMMRFHFITATDEVLASLLPLLQAIYSAVISTRENTGPKSKRIILPKAEDILTQDYMKLVQRIKRDAPEVFELARENKFDILLEPVERLIKLRKDVYDNIKEPPTVEDARKLFNEVQKAYGFFMAIVSVTMSAASQGYLDFRL